MDKEGFEKLYSNLPFPNKVIMKNPDSRRGLALLWKNDVNLEVINFTTNYILAKVMEEDEYEWYFTYFYGWPEAQQKEESWRLLAHLKSFLVGPWLAIGDFNAFLNASEKKSMRVPQTSKVEAFREVPTLGLGIQGIFVYLE